ncbi:hypothetical protein ACFL1N_02240 [Thermodesulfobacteriota bacterium]
MVALLFVLIVTGSGVFISYSMSTDGSTWMDYYRGGIIGLFLSGVILYMVNKRRRAKEMSKKD